MTRLPAAQRRQQLLDCAAELFADLGYARATTAQLAKAAGVTEPILYRHFASKRDLFVALIDRTSDDTIHEWEADLAEAKDPAHRLRLLLDDNPMVKPGGQSAYRVILQAMTEVDDPLIKDALDRHMKRLHAFIAAEIRRAQETHRVTARFSADIIAWMLIYLGLGYGVLSAFGVPGHGTDASGAHVRHVLGRILVGRDARPGEA
jgi:AcrR family transcriptional regulator